MRSLVVIFAAIGTSAVAHAQSRADQVPPSRTEAPMPVSPIPSDATNDQPAHALPDPEIVPTPQEPASKLVLARPTDDTLSGHLLLGLGTSYSNVFGSLDSSTSLRSVVSGGFNLNIGVGYGLSRAVEAQLLGSFASFSSSTDCASCSAKSYALTAALNYHIVQGVRFDPWVRAGLGVSAFSLNGAPGKRDYVGLQWLNATIGGDWYLSRHFGLGPMLSIALTSYLDHPSDSRTSIAAQWVGGLNFTVDGTGK